MINQLNKIRLPQKISPCPIFEAIVELRVNSKLPHDAVIGVIYNELKDQYPKMDRLPILQFPETLRSNNPNIKYLPHYKLSDKEGFLFQVGPRVFSLLSPKPYVGWQTFSKKINNILDRIERVGVVDSYSRLGIRYRNAFTINILEHMDLSFKVIESVYNLNFKTSLRVEIPTVDFTNTIQITNCADIMSETETKRGSIIDIDTIHLNPQKDIKTLIDQGHTWEKRIFFHLLKKEFIDNELNPEYK